MVDKLKILVVDDSALYRQVLVDALKGLPQVEVVGTAEDGYAALEAVERLQPHLVTLDVEMPRLDGLQVLERLQREYPSVRALMVSRLAERSAGITLKALRLGALDFVVKPANAGSIEENLRRIRGQLLPRIRHFAAEFFQQSVRRESCGHGNIQLFGKVSRLPRDVIAVGVSTGGPRCLSALFEQLPASLPQAMLIVQHMPPVFTQKLADQLTHVGTIPVHEAREGEVIEAGVAYIAPGDFHMQVEEKNGKKVVRLRKDPPVNFCRPSVDVLFLSVAKAYGNHAVGVIMTGMGRDGVDGCRALKQAGAAVVAQDQHTSVVWGMPGAVVKSGLADAVAPVDQLFEAIQQFIL